MGTRNLILGLIVLLAGLQFRAVETFVLTQEASRFLQQKLSSDSYLTSDDPYAYRGRSFDSMLLNTGPVMEKRLTPPRWLGWAMISFGAVLVLNGLTTRRG